MIKIAVCDNDNSITGYTEELLSKLGQSLSQSLDVSVFFSGEDFCKHLLKSGEVFDIVLMDIEMGEISGVEAGKMLRKSTVYDQTFLIYISSHDNYYKEIIDLNVHSFIPKPFNVAEFNLKLSKVIEKVIKKRHIQPYPEYSFNKGGNVFYVPVNSIIYMESELRKIHLYLEHCTHTFYGNLNAEEKKLPGNLFCRIHKSFIISFAHMTQITAQSVTIAGQTLSISVKYREAVKQAYNNYRST